MTVSTLDVSIYNLSFKNGIDSLLYLVKTGGNKRKINRKEMVKLQIFFVQCISDVNCGPIRRFVYSKWRKKDDD